MPPTPDKLQWADRHLKLFEREVRKFLRGNSYRIVEKGSGAQGKIEWHLRLLKPLPGSEWGLIAGDVVHALRSRLDHLAWTLAGRDPEDHRTQFPICTRRGRFTEQAYRIKRLPDGARTLVKCLQPYRRTNPESDGLAILADLDDMDKHRTIPLVLSTLEETDFIIKPGTDTQADVTFTAGPLNLNRAPILLARISFDPPDPKMKVKADFKIGVAFGQDCPTSIRFRDPLEVLPSLRGRVADVLSLFDRFEQGAD